MVSDLEELLEKYGGCAEVNALWRHISGRNFISEAQIRCLTEAAVEVLTVAGVPVVLLGTAHTSRRSANLAAGWIKQLQPAALVLERCPERLADLSWPKALLMDSTAKLRSIEVAGRGTLSADELRQISPPGKPVSSLSDKEAQTRAINLWTEFEGLNTERNQLVEEAAFLTWVEQRSSARRPRLLALGDVRQSVIGIPSGEGGGGPDREALLASLPPRDRHMCGCIAACASCIQGPVLAVLGANHMAGVTSSLQDLLGARRITQEALTEFSADGKLDVPPPDVARVFASRWKGALLREPAISEIADFHLHRRALLQEQVDLDANGILDEYIADVEGDEALFQRFVSRGLAIELSNPADRLPKDAMGSLRTWLHHGGEWPIFRKKMVMGTVSKF